MKTGIETLQSSLQTIFTVNNLKKTLGNQTFCKVGPNVKIKIAGYCARCTDYFKKKLNTMSKLSKFVRNFTADLN